MANPLRTGLENSLVALERQADTTTNVTGQCGRGKDTFRTGSQTERAICRRLYNGPTAHGFAKQAYVYSVSRLERSNARVQTELIKPSKDWLRSAGETVLQLLWKIRGPLVYVLMFSHDPIIFVSATSTILTSRSTNETTLLLYHYHGLNM